MDEPTIIFGLKHIVIAHIEAFWTEAQTRVMVQVGGVVFYEDQGSSRQAEEKIEMIASRVIHYHNR